MYTRVEIRIIIITITRLADNDKKKKKILSNVIFSFYYLLRVLFLVDR